MKVKAEIEGEIIFAIDPKVSLTLLVPWGKPEDNLREYLMHYLEYLREFNPHIPPNLFLEYFKEYLPDKLPGDWAFAFSPQTIEGFPGKPNKFTLTLTTPGQGKTLLAVKVIDQRNPTRFVVSEIIGIQGHP